MTPVATRTVPTRIGDLRVEVLGTGPPAVLWHSLFVDSRQWNGVRDALAGHRTLVLVDGPGHGGSGPAPGPFTLDDCAAAAAEIIGGPGPADWVGSAWGGHVGLVLAARHPGLVRTLVTIGTPVGALHRPERARVALLAAVYRRTGPVRLLVDRVVAALVRDADGPAAQVVREHLAGADRSALVDAVRSVSLHRPDLTDLLPRVGVPALLLTGDDDPLWTPAAVDAAARRMPDASGATVPASRHLPPLENPAAVIDHILKFWARAPRDGQERP